ISPTNSPASRSRSPGWRMACRSAASSTISTTERLPLRSARGPLSDAIAGQEGFRPNRGLEMSSLHAATLRRIGAILSILLSALIVPPASAAKVDALFRAWLESDLWPEAKSQGISRATFDAAFAGVTPNLKLPDLVMPGEKAKTPKKQHQAEF